MSREIKGKTPFRRLLITANEFKTKSNIILSSKNDSPKGLSDVQEVVQIGNLVKDSGLDVKVGDKVLLNVERFNKSAFPMRFKKDTGEPADYTDTEETADLYFLIEAQEVVYVFPKED